MCAWLSSTHTKFAFEGRAQPQKVAAKSTTWPPRAQDELTAHTAKVKSLKTKCSEATLSAKCYAVVHALTSFHLTSHFTSYHVTSHVIFPRFRSSRIISHHCTSFFYPHISSCLPFLSSSLALSLSLSRLLSLSAPHLSHVSPLCDLPPPSCFSPPFLSSFSSPSSSATRLPLAPCSNN